MNMRKRIFLTVPFLLLLVAGRAQVPDVRVTRAEHLLSLLVKEEYGAVVSQFDSVLRERLPATMLQQVWESLQQQVGPYRACEHFTVERSDPYFSVLLTCRYGKGVLLDLKLVYDDRGKVTGIFFFPSRQYTWEIPSYADTTRFVREPFVVESDGYRLHGEMTTPVDTSFYPVVVMVQGSGPMDMDETIGPNKIFRDLAYGLSSHGIAVIRYNKRTFEYAGRLSGDSLTVWEETIDDAVAAVRLAEKIPGASGVFLLGHSLGGYLAPRIATRAPGLSGLILMAANTRPLPRLILQQTTYLLSLDTLTAAERAQLDTLRKKVERVLQGDYDTTTPADQLPLGIPARYWLDLQQYDPLATVDSLTLPMLIMQGGRDYQVTTLDFNEWKHALASRTNVDFRIYGDLDHLFLPGDGKSRPEDYLLPSHVPGKVILDIVDWIRNVPRKAFGFPTI